MSRGALVQGFDYVTGKPVAMTAAEWRAKYPAQKYRRGVSSGETWFRPTDGEWSGRLVAEAYAIIPVGKGVASDR